MNSSANLIAPFVAALLVLALLMLFTKSAQKSDPEVSINDFFFQPASLNISTGSVVTWTNRGAAPHTVSSNTGAFESGTLQPSQHFSHTFSTPGVYAYHCNIHPQMRGTITVS